MKLLQSLLLATAFTLANAAAAGPLTVGGALPPLQIDDRGEIILQGDDVDYAPWDSGQLQGGVHVVQYIGATMGDKDKFKPLTDKIEKDFAPGSVTVTTLINMDAALWGTGGLVASEIKKNKRAYPEAIIVLDEDGAGTKTWGLGEDGIALLIIDSAGVVRYVRNEGLDDETLAEPLDLLRTQVEG
ncbi:MAG: hypothetical protein HKN19_17090 [Halioglobus sp.]|nr:hypothetical protein [Halioglobus sp.]